MEALKVEWGGDGSNGIIMGCGINLAIGTDNGGASIVMTNRIIAYAIDSYDVTLVFDGSCSKQNITYSSARLWPTGYIDAEVVRGGEFRVES
jgi:hypothetical protein